MELYDNPDTDEECCAKQYRVSTEGEFVIVKVAGKARIKHYIGRIDVVDGNEFEGVFLRRVLGRNQMVAPTFVVNDEDTALWTVEDIARKLPTPIIVGSAKRAQLQFSCSFDNWNID